MSVFSINDVITQKIFKQLIDMNYHVIVDELIQKKNNIEAQERNEISLKEEINDVNKDEVVLSLKPLINYQPMVSLSLKNPKECQYKIPFKDRCSLILPNLKTMDDIYDIQNAITYILSHSEELEYKILHPYYKWECENFSEEYGYTHFYVVVSSLIKEEDDTPYYAIEVQRVSGTKSIIRYVLHELTERLNIV
jgi:hypothetical protein